MKTLECAVCGSGCRGKQWWNRDHGYGLCPNCYEWLKSRGESEESIIDCYGYPGVNFEVKADIDA